MHEEMADNVEMVHYVKPNVAVNYRLSVKDHLSPAKIHTSGRQFRDGGGNTPQ